MSTPAPGGSGDGGGGEEKPRGFQRFMRRASSVLRRDKSKGQSVSGGALQPVKDEGPSTSAPVAAVPPIEPTEFPKPAPPVPVETTKETPAEPPSTKAKGPTTAAESHKILEEKARALFAKYDMTLEAGEWTPVVKGDGVRVEKKVRIRVKRHCHRCQTGFGTETQCTNCSHKKCKRCPRTPSGIRSKDGKPKISVTAGSIIVDDAYKGLMNLESLAMPYRRSTKEFGYPATFRKICHKCQTAFPGAAPQCGKCGHTRCAQCHQDPPTLTPLSGVSMPRRRQMRSLRLRIRYSCHECQKTFKDLEQNCSRCSHRKCDDCLSDPGLKLEAPLLDPDALRSVEEKLRNLDVSPQASAA